MSGVVLFEGVIRFEQGTEFVPVRLGSNHFTTREQLEIDLLRPRLTGETVGDQVGIEVAIAIVVGEAHHDARTGEGETVFLSPFDERAPAVVDEQAVAGSVATDVEVEKTIALDIDEGRADRPVVRKRASDSCGRGDVFEFDPAEISIQARSAIGTGKENFREPVVVDIAECDATACKRGGNHLAFPPIARCPAVDKVDTRFGSGDWLEQPRARSVVAASLGEGSRYDLAGGDRRRAGESLRLGLRQIGAILLRLRARAD